MSLQLQQDVAFFLILTSLPPAESTRWVVLPRKLFLGDRDGSVSELVIFDSMVHEHRGHSDGTLWSSLFTAMTDR